jgi:hypothetical protein
MATANIYVKGTEGLGDAHVWEEILDGSWGHPGATGDPEGAANEQGSKRPRPAIGRANANSRKSRD